MGELKYVCFYCGRVYSISTTTSGSDSAYRRGDCGCDKGELTQKRKPDEQREKYYSRKRR